MNAFEAYWWIYNHPNCVEIDPEHPLVDMGEYTIKLGDTVFDVGKEPDDEYRRAANERAFTDTWRGQFIDNLEFDYHMVDPTTRAVDVDNPSNNTHMEVWFETGPAYWNKYADEYASNMHDIRLDCSGATFEEALINLAALIKKYYGDYNES
jgi:hypothetical protein